MVVLGGRPGTYKSAIAWQILLRAASRGTPVGIVSLEMNHAELASRALAHELKINGHAFVSGDRRVVEEVQRRQNPDMRQWPIRIDSRSTKLGEIIARIIEWKYRYDIQLACLDHIQLVAHEKSQNRFLELSEVSRQMKLLAMRLDIPILVLSQLSREVEKENRQPRDSDLRECGNLEQDADIIIFTHCKKGKGIEEDNHEMILSKQRGGAARQVIDLVVNGEYFLVGEAA
jgi:replicative DNA helicase